MNSVGEFWKIYATRPINKDLDAKEMKRVKDAFYGGAFTIMQIVKTFGNGDKSQEACKGILAGIDKEVLEYALHQLVGECFGREMAADLLASIHKEILHGRSN
jgi:hypothetical protein